MTKRTSLQLGLQLLLFFGTGRLLLAGPIGEPTDGAPASPAPAAAGTSAPASDGEVNSTYIGHQDADHRESDGHATSRFEVLKFDFHKVAMPFFISFWILIASIAKIGFHFHHKLPSLFPESSLLIVLGIVMGVVFYYATDHKAYHMMDAHTFFYFLLPPIILESGYFMPNRAFFDNIGTILLYAVVGTLFNTFAIGLSLWGLSVAGAMGDGGSLQLLHCLLFSSLVSAVDPVAVLAVFEEIHVNQMLHIIVFGESLLNDAVTVVLYHMFEAYSHMGSENVQVVDIVAGVAAFFVVGLGGTAMGLLFGLVGAFVTKFTSHVRVIEPIFIFLIAYLSYLAAETFHFSGIMALTFCGMTMKRYAEPNISEKSQTTVKYFMKMLSSVSETIIFLFLGTSTVMDSHAGNAVFIIATLAFCLLYRVIGVVSLTAIVNRYRMLKLSYVDQFVMSYSGLRGAVAFALAITLDSDVIGSKNLFVTTTMAVILFTVFAQGTTIKPLVNRLHVKKQNKEELTMSKQINERMIHYLMGGIEEVCGYRGNHWLRHRFEYYDNKYLKKYLLRERPRTRETAILRVSSKLSLRDAMEQAQKPGFLNRVNSSGSGMNNIGFINEPSHFKINRNMSEASLRKCLTLEALDPLYKLSTSGTVIDIQALDATCSKKMADDSKTHHILADNAVYPRKKWSKRKRSSDVDDSEPHVPTHRHHHTFRLHLRPVISQQQQRKQQRSRRSGASAPANLMTSSSAGDQTDEAIKCPKNVTFCETVPEVPPCVVTALDDLMPKQGLSILDPTISDADENDEDIGIIFRASSFETHQDEALPASSYLPWRSDSTGNGAGGATSGSGSSHSTLPWHTTAETTQPGLREPSPRSTDDDEAASSRVDAGHVMSPGSVAEQLPWRQVDDSTPELSYRAQSEVPVLALVTDNLSDGGSAATSPVHNSPRSVSERYGSVYPNDATTAQGDKVPATFFDRSFVGSAIGGAAVDHSGHPVEELPPFFANSQRRASSDWKFLPKMEDTVYEADEDVDSSGNDQGSSEGGDNGVSESESTDTGDEEAPLSFKNLQRAKNSIERLNEHLFRKRQAHSDEERSPLCNGYDDEDSSAA